MNVNVDTAIQSKDSTDVAHTQKCMPGFCCAHHQNQNAWGQQRTPEVGFSFHVEALKCRRCLCGGGVKAPTRVCGDLVSMAKSKLQSFSPP